MINNYCGSATSKRVVQTHAPPPPAGTSEAHHALVYNDLRNPGLKARLSAKRGQVPEGRKVSRLNGVQELVAISHYLARKFEGRSIVALEQLGDRVHIAIPKIRDQLQFRFGMHSFAVENFNVGPEEPGIHFFAPSGRRQPCCHRGPSGLCARPNDTNTFCFRNASPGRWKVRIVV
jgi:hypothetical protein